MGPLVGIGGVCVADTAVLPLEQELERLCNDVGFPSGEEFKWSPCRTTWMWKNLHEDRRLSFFQGVLTAASAHKATVTVVIADARYRHAVTTSSSVEADVTTMFLERTNNALRSARTFGEVIFDPPGGNRAGKRRLLNECLDTLTVGTRYVLPDRITNIRTEVSHNSRMIQLADLVTGCTVSYVGGGPYSSAVFTFVSPLLRRDGGRIGGVGLKLHPDLRYMNLYHGLLGDDVLWKGSSGVGLPCPGRPYFRNAG
jgi:hypothetical protein